MTGHAGDLTVTAHDVLSSEAGVPRRRRRSLRLLGVLVGVALVVGLTTVAITDPPASTRQAQSPLVGHLAPVIAGTTLSGQGFSLTGLRGHYVVVDFFSSWCVVCQQEQPQLNAFVAEHQGPTGPRLVGVIFDDNPSAIRRFLGPELGRFAVIADPRGQIALHYGVRNPPEKYLIAPDGVIVAKVVGGVTAAGLDQLISRAQSTGA